MKRILVTLLILLAASPAMAMRSYTGWAQSDTGDRLYQAEIRVYLAGTEGATSAIIYSDDGITPMAQPILTDYHGKYRFYVADGTYDIKSSYGGSDTWLYDVQIVDHLQFKIDDAEFGAISGDGIDDAPAIQAAIDAAAAATPIGMVKIPVGQFDVYSTITFTDDVAIRGEGFKSELVSHITDGSAVLEDVATGQQRVHIEDISIVSSDPDVTGNWIGLNIDCNRGFLKNVRVRRAATGIRLSGFIWDMVNVWTYYCTTGFHADEFNSIRANINTEVCTTGVIIEDGGAIQLTGVNEDNAIGLLVDGVTGLDACLWFESNDSLDVRAGATSLCKDLTFTGVFDSGDFWNVNGLDLSALHLTGNGPVYISDSALNVRGLPTPVPGTYDGDYSLPRGIRTESGFQGPQNYFPDPYFIHGFEAVSDTTGSAREGLSIDTTHEIGGGGLKVQSAGAGAGSTYSWVTLPPSVAGALAGKTARVGAWVYIPDDDTNYPAGTSDIRPDLTVSYYDGSWHENGTASQTWYNDGWTFFSGLYPIGASATGIRIGFYQSRNGSYSVPAGTYVTFSGVFLGESDATVTDIALGKWTEHELASAARLSVYDAWKYGARPDDATDDTAAIQAAIDAAERNHGGVVTLPAGQFRLTGAGLTIEDHGVILRGATRGYENEADRGTVLAPLSAMSGPLLTISSGGVFSIYRSGVENITFRSGGAYYSDGLLALVNCRDCIVRDCSLYMNDSEANGNAALMITSTSSLASTGNRIEDCYIHSTRYLSGPTNGTGYGVEISNPTGTYNTSNYFTNCKFYDPSNSGDGSYFVLETGTNVGANIFSNCHFGTTADGTNKGLHLAGLRGGDVLQNCIIDGEAADTLLTFGDLTSGAAASYFQGSIDGVWVDLNDSEDDYATVIDNGDDNQMNIRALRLIPRSAMPASPALGSLAYDSDTNDVMVYTDQGWEILFDGAD